MNTLFVKDTSISRTSSTTSQFGAYLARSRSTRSKRASWACSNTTSGASYSPSECYGITSSQQASPAGSPELEQRLMRGRSLRLRVADVGDSLLAGLKPREDDKVIPIVRRRSLTDAPWPPRPALIEEPSNSPITEEAMKSKSTLTMAHREMKTASTDALSYEAPTRCSSLEVEMNVDKQIQETLAKALPLLSLNSQPSTATGCGRHPSLRTSIIRDLDLPEQTSRALHALVTNAFTPAQLPAACKIQRFMYDNPEESIPRFLVTDEIAEIHGDYGWCLIGKCGLERISYKLDRPTSTSTATDEFVERDQSRREIQRLCGHIRDRHFQMPFQCRLCPASYITQDGLNSHWRTHPVGDFACPACGAILISEIAVQKHQHSKHAKSPIPTKFLRFLSRAVPLK